MDDRQTINKPARKCQEVYCLCIGLDILMRVFIIMKKGRHPATVGCLFSVIGLKNGAICVTINCTNEFIRI